MCYHYEILHLLATIHVLFADFLLAEDDNRRKINDFKKKGGVEHITLAATLARLEKNTSVEEAGHARQEQAAAADDTLACNAPDAADEIRRATDTIQLPAQVGEQPHPHPNASFITPAPARHSSNQGPGQLAQVAIALDGAPNAGGNSPQLSLTDRFISVMWADQQLRREEAQAQQDANRAQQDTNRINEGRWEAQQDTNQIQQETNRINERRYDTLRRDVDQQGRDVGEIREKQEAKDGLLRALTQEIRTVKKNSKGVDTDIGEYLMLELSIRCLNCTCICAHTLISCLLITFSLLGAGGDTAAAGAGGGLGKGSEVKNLFPTSADDDVFESSISDDDNTSGHVDRGDNEDEMSEAGNGMKYCQRCNSAYDDAHERHYNGQLEQERAIYDFEQCKKNCTAKGCASNS